MKTTIAVRKSGHSAFASISMRRTRSLYDFHRPAMGRTRGQGTIEYVLILGAVLMVVALTANFLLNNVLKTQTKQLGNESDQIKGYKEQLRAQTQTLGSGGPSNPAANPSGGPAAGSPNGAASGPSATPAPLAGQIMRLLLDENPATHGSALADSSGSNNPGSLLTSDGGTNKAVLGRIGGALALDGINDYVYVSHSASLNIEQNQPFTLSAWIRTNTNQDSVIMAKEENQGNYRGYYLIMSGTSGQVYSILENDNDHYLSVGGSTRLNDDRFHHVAMAYDGSSKPSGIKVYVDGQPETLRTDKDTLGSNTILNSVPLTVGARDSGGVPFRGIIDDVQVYNRALNAQEIQALAAG